MTYSTVQNISHIDWNSKEVLQHKTEREIENHDIIAKDYGTYRAETEGPVNNIDSITQYRALHSLQTPSVPVVLELFGLCMYCALNTTIYIES